MMMTMTMTTAAASDEIFCQILTVKFWILVSGLFTLSDYWVLKDEGATNVTIQFLFLRPKITYSKTV